MAATTPDEITQKNSRCPRTTRRHWPRDVRRDASCAATSRPWSRPSPGGAASGHPSRSASDCSPSTTRWPTADPLSRLHLIEERQRLEAELSHTGETVDLAALEKSFIKVARVYGERKGISYSAWRTVGVSASVLQQAKIPRTRS